MIDRPLIGLLFSYISGLILGTYFIFPANWLLTFFPILIAFHIILIIYRKKLVSYLPFLFFLILGIIFVNRYLHFQPPPGHVAAYVGDRKINIGGTIFRSPEMTEKSTRVYLEVERVYLERKEFAAFGKVMISVREWEGRLDYGDRIRTTVKLRRPRNFYNPGGFDYERYLASRRIYATGYLKNSREIIRVGKGEFRILFKIIDRLRVRIREAIEDGSNFPARGILKALILGERGEISEEVRESFIIAGAAHILAISGLHIGILASIVFWFFCYLLKISERVVLKINIFKVASALTILPLVIYTLIAGARVSTVRALIMVITYLVAIIIDQEREIFNTLALAALIILLLFPPSLFDISFQLSFVSVWAIIYIVPRALEFLKREEALLLSDLVTPFRRFMSRVGVFVLVSLSAIIGTAPLVAHYFNRLNIWGIFTNLAVIPLIGFLSVPLCLLAGFFTIFHQSTASFLFYIASLPVDMSIWIVDLINCLPFATFRVSTPRISEILLCYLLIISLVNFKRLWLSRYISCILFLAGLINFGYWFQTNNHNPELRVSFLSVGQGDCALIEFPRGVKMLIDGGGFYDESFDTGKLIVAPFLWRKRIKKIDYLVMSHPQIDHFGGLKFIAQNFKVKELWINGDEGRCPAYCNFMNVINGIGIKKVFLSADSPDRIINGVKVEFLGPPKDKVTSGPRQNRIDSSDLNNNSLVIRILFGKLSLLFPGDIQYRGENLLCRSGRDLKSTVIKVPHHGSNDSSSYRFLQKIRPEVAVISVGYKNIFGTPKEKVLKRYEQIGAKVYRTDRDGAIKIESNGEEFKIKIYLENGL
ncbi:MAG: DNA internalization-related competence protein ComEC/Rec2 [Deltaproteobacteria bacterium]|nr:MAG: DNA internalization-related competence protein ComEC/Rec2 [Deltaproteobacteria bacterium]